MNARSLINFFNLRLCYRNTDEIRIIANKMFILCKKHLPELFNYIGPDCIMKKYCTQGNMKANKCKNKNEKKNLLIILKIFV